MTGIAEVENAMLGRLRAASDADVLGYKYRTLESYPEEFDEYLKTEIKGGAQFPAAWVVFGGWRRPTQALRKYSPLRRSRGSPAVDGCESVSGW